MAQDKVDIDTSVDGVNVKKVVRTFAGDMDALKSGGTAGFKSIADQSTQPTKEDLIAQAAASKPQAPGSVGAPVDISGTDGAIDVQALAAGMKQKQGATKEDIVVPAAEEEKAGTVGTAAAIPAVPIPRAATPAERLIEASALSVPPPPTTAPASTLPAVPKKPKPKVAIETYAGDFSQRMKEEHASKATVLAAQEDASTAAPQKTEEKKPSNVRAVLAVLLGLVLIVGGGAGAYVAYTDYSANTVAPVIAPGASTPIFVDARRSVSGSGDSLFQAIAQSSHDPLALGTVRLLSLATSSTDTNVFLALNVKAPDILLRNINVTGSMAGIIRTDTSESPFFILSVDSYKATFSGMLTWETTMPNDLSTLFPPYTQSDATTTATSSVSAVPQTPGFKDETVSNHDVRVYQDAEGRSVLLYGYWSPSVLIIARDAQAFSEIIGRLATSHGQ